MNLKVGLIRLWVSISIIWLAFSTYEIITNHRDWQACFKAANTFSDILTKQHSSLYDELFSKKRDAHGAFIKAGIKIDFDEISAKNESWSKASEILKETEDYKLKEQFFASAFESRDRRDLYAKLLPTIPLATMILFLFLYWTTCGFKRPSPPSNT